MTREKKLGFQDAWEFLDRLQLFKIKLGLDSMRGFLEDLESPHQVVPFVHIAGTNGKGSTAAFLASILEDTGLRVGLYSSPHLETVRERFRINGDMISEQAFARHAGRIISILAGRRITYFEFTTALAFCWFAAAEVDMAIIEVGMGGRLDATNVITPLVSIITNVSMDHEQYLGHRLADVAREKAGIVKHNVPVVAAVSVVDGDSAAVDVVRETCADRQAPLRLLHRDFSMDDHGGSLHYQGLPSAATGTVDRLELCHLVLGLRGVHQRENAALALACSELLVQKGVDIPEESMRRGLAAATWPGRLESFSCRRNGGPVQVVLDGAHNPAGVRALASALHHEYCYRNLYLVWGAMVDKDGSGTLPHIAPLARSIFLVQPQGDRSAGPERLRQFLAEPLQSRARICSSVREGLYAALDAAGTEDLVCVAGSLYLIGEVRQVLGLLSS